ncbi:hypothetical protein FB2170_15423 [Maribacter sp. HTCC2170]|nr:hypothetical protein FB2170_15423 [Maribacter sp. HTCC2170]
MISYAPSKLPARLKKKHGIKYRIKNANYVNKNLSNE